MRYLIRYKEYIIITYGVVLSSTISITSCRKFIEVPPPITNVTGANVYNIDASAVSVLTGLYAAISAGGPGSFATGRSGISLKSGLSADEFRLYNGTGDLTLAAYYSNRLAASINLNYGSEAWNLFYNYIFICNSALKGLAVSTTLTPGVRQQLLGEAKFMRAFFYFYLVTLYGDVPLVLNTDYEINRLLARSPADQIWQQIVSDLKEAQNLLSYNYLREDALTAYPTGLEERIRPTKGAAMALLARVYLYTEDWQNAEALASEVINYSSLYTLANLNDVFIKNNMEAIFQLQPVNAGWNTEDAKTFILTVSGPSTEKPTYLSPELLQAFEKGDLRKTNWIGNTTLNTDTFYYPHKYKIADYGAPVTEYLMVLRLGEQYLIRAEARAHLMRIEDAKTDINYIRTRAGLPNITAYDKATLLQAIIHERQIELFSEWGHRWLDLKRTGKVDAVMITACRLKGGVWQSFQQWYPLPFNDIQRNPNLVQTKGY